MVASIASLLTSQRDDPSRTSTTPNPAVSHQGFADVLQNTGATSDTENYQYLPRGASSHYETRNALGDPTTLITGLGGENSLQSDQTVQIRLFDETTHTVEVREISIHSADSKDETTTEEFVAGLNQIPGLTAQVGDDGRLRIDSNRPGMVFTIEGSPGGVIDALGQDDPALREAFESFVGEFFFGQMLKEMRKSLSGSAYMNGGNAEETFTKQLDQILAQDLSKSSAGNLTRTMYDQQFRLTRS